MLTFTAIPRLLVVDDKLLLHPQVMYTPTSAAKSGRRNLICSSKTPVTGLYVGLAGNAALQSVQLLNRVRKRIRRLHYSLGAEKVCLY
jgi:hypothetical protein